jgi:PAS domain S-box-containing protein
MAESVDASELELLQANRLPVVPGSGRAPLVNKDPRSGPPDHLVEFYEDEARLCEVVTGFLADGIRAGELGMVIATEPRRRAFEHQLRSLGFEVGRLLESEQLTFLDAHEALSRIMRDGEPDPARFEAEVGARIDRQIASGKAGRVRVYGELADVLWAEERRSAALLVEELWSELGARQPAALRCASAMASFYKEHVAAGVGDGDVAAGAAELPPTYARRLAREIARRNEVEHALRASLRELRRKEAQLRHREEQLRDFVENGVVGLHQVGPDGIILWANHAELDMLGFTRDEYIGRPVADVHADPDVIADILARLSRGEALHSYEARLRAKDGSIRHVLISSNVYARDGQFVHTRCFTRDITERKRAEEALRERERQLQSITDALPVLVAFIDTELRYRFVSAAYEAWFARPLAELVGKHVEEVVGAAAYAVVRAYMDRALAGEVVAYEAELPYPRGVTRSVSAKYIPQRGDDGRVTGFVALVDDITERRGFERYRAASAVRAERLLKITSALADAVMPTEVFEAVVDHVRVAVDASTTGLWLVDDDGRTARLVRSIGYSETAARAITELPLDASPSVPALDSIRRGEPIWISSQEDLLRAYPHLASTVTPGRSYRVASLPLISNDRTLGALAITIDDGPEALEEERSFLQLVARYATQAIERLRLLEAERKSRAEADAAAARMSVLSHASRVFVEANLHLAARLEDIVRELGTALDSSVAISLLESDGRLHPTAPYHPAPEAHERLRTMFAVEAPLRVGEGVTGAVAQTGKSVLVPAIDPAVIASRAAPAYRSFVERYPVHALMCAPLRVRGRMIGVVSASRTRAGQTYTPADLELLEALADRAAAAIENSRLHQENVEARARAEQLYRFAHAAVSAEKVEQVFAAALDALEGALGVDRAAILMFDAEGVMRFRAWRRLSDELRAAMEGHAPWPRDAAAPQPVLMPDALRDAVPSAYQPLLHAEGIASLAFVPLVTRGRLLGMFLVGHARPHTSSASELELVCAIANHLASIASRFAAVAELERTLHYNELFAGILAHDLRNPLGAIVTAAQLLLMQQEGEGNRSAKPLNRILSSSQRMSRMIAQLLDLTRARTGGGIELAPREASLADLCDQAVGELELVYPDRKIERDYTGDPTGVWDPDRLLQIISNLVANAGEHATAGSGISIRLDGRHPEAVSLEVHNEGAIPPGLIPSLFDPFRGARPRRSGSRGLGLGLFIVQEMVRGHRGTVDVTSSEAHGTTFTVRLPRRPVRA